MAVIRLRQNPKKIKKKTKTTQLCVPQTWLTAPLQVAAVAVEVEVAICACPGNRHLQIVQQIGECGAYKIIPRNRFLLFFVVYMYLIWLGVLKCSQLKKVLFYTCTH